MRMLFIIRVFAFGVATVGLLHSLAWLSVPDGLGFNPHPWYLASPDWLRRAIVAAGIPRGNLEVFISYFALLPWYVGAIVIGSIVLWIEKRRREPTE